MPVRAQALTMHYFATDADGPKTGDVGNHALRIIEDGVVGTIAASPAEIDATNAPGIYKVAITAAENTADVVTLCGKSSTSGVTISPSTWTNITNADASVAAILTDTGTTLDDKLDTITAYEIDIAGKAALILADTAVLGASPIAANVTQINGDANAPVVQAAGALAMQREELLTGSTTGLLKAASGTLSNTDDFYNDRFLIFTTGALTGQGRRVQDYTGATYTFQADGTYTSAPVNGDDFIIV